MIGYAGRRFGWALLTVWLTSIAAFVLFWAIPNVDPAFLLGGAEKGTEWTRERATREYRLDDPLPAQYVRMMQGLLNGDLQCFYSCGNLRSTFVEAFPVTFWLVAGAAVIAIGVGTGVALVCVRYRGRWPDRALTTAAGAAYSVPSLVLAALLWAFVAYKWRLFPAEGYVALTDDAGGWFRHLLLPWIASALPFAGAYVLVVRASLLEVAEEDWVRTARAKGLGEGQVLRRHVLRNGLVPPMNVWGLDMSHAFGGFVLYVEVIFGLPGVGLLTAATVDGFDLPAIVALAVYLAFVVVFVSAIVDVLVAWLDPRARRGAALL